MPTSESLFLLDPSVDPETLVREVTAGRAVERRHEPCRRVVYYDTFDRRLSKGGSQLWTVPVRGARELHWRRPDAELVALPSSEVAFADALPEGRLREELAAVVEMRRLLPTVEVERDAIVVEVLGPRRKTVARLGFERGRARDPHGPSRWRRMPPRLRAVPLRGYERHTEELVERLRAERLLSERAATEMDLALSVTGRAADPLPPSPRLAPDVRADVGSLAIYRALLAKILANEGGLRADLDSEFLHDFRVAVRRTRSLLTQLKGVLPLEVVEHFRRELAWLGQVTGPTRDWDVFLLDWSPRAKAAAGLEEEGLSAVRAYARREKERAHARMVAELSGERYRELVRDWGAFLHRAPPDPGAPRAREPLRDVASDRIRRRFRRILKRGAAIRAKSPPDRLHELRIDCKKMRYLVDCTAGVFPEADVSEVLGTLKGLQNVLGTFNDCAVQAERLRSMAGALAAEAPVAAATLVTLGRLVERVEARAAKARGRFRSRFESFAAPGNVALLERLFQRAGAVAPRERKGAGKAKRRGRGRRKAAP